MRVKVNIFIVVVFCFFSARVSAQEGGLKSNLLYDMTGTLNFGMEFSLDYEWTLDVSANYNAWNFSPTRKMKHWLLQPELRWWVCEPFSGHFFGTHAHVGQFNLGGMLPFGFGAFRNKHIEKNRYEGWLAGVGVSYGYNWILGKHWSVEATLGVGYAYVKYDKFRCENCGEKLDSGVQHYLGPTKAAVNLIYYY